LYDLSLGFILSFPHSKLNECRDVDLYLTG